MNGRTERRVAERHSGDRDTEPEVANILNLIIGCILITFLIRPRLRGARD